MKRISSRGEVDWQYKRLNKLRKLQLQPFTFLLWVCCWRKCLCSFLDSVILIYEIILKCLTPKGQHVRLLPVLSASEERLMRLFTCVNGAWIRLRAMWHLSFTLSEYCVWAKIFEKWWHLLNQSHVYDDFLSFIFCECVLLNTVKTNQSSQNQNYLYCHDIQVQV